jgi:hypothetical protein
MMKVRIATGLGLVLLMAAMVGGPVRVSQAQDDEGGVTLASLAGKYAARGSGFETVCFNAGFTALADCSLSTSHLVPFESAFVSHFTRDKAGNTCVVINITSAPVSGTNSPALGNPPQTFVITTISFDPTTGSGTESFSQYQGGGCNGVVFNSAGATLVATGTQSLAVSDSGKRIEIITTSFNAVGNIIQGVVSSATAIRQ